KPVAAGASWTAAEVAALQHDVDAIVDGSPTLKGAHSGILAVETATGRVLYARATDDAFMPASTMKVLTGSAALALLGPSFTFKTRVALADDNRLILSGGGDALLRAADLDAAAAAVAAAGITSVAGLAADDGYFDRRPYPDGWVWDDFPFYFAPVVSAVCLEDNVLHAVITPASPGAPPAVALAPTSSLATENRATTGPPGSKDTLDVDRDGSTILFVGSIPANAKPEKLDAAVPDPPAYALDVFARALAAHGVSVAVDTLRPPPTGSAAGARILWTHESAPLARYLHDFWFPSDNLVGELLLKSLGVARSGVPGTSEHGAALENEWLRSLGIDPLRLDVTDGSGLSIYDRLSPRVLVRLLQYDWNGPNRDAVLDALPVIDFNGTAASMRVFAKTGTRRYARGLAGYLRPHGHGAITFALMVDDWMGDDDGMYALRARVLARLAR
ncbi:MAG: D-alanyl-D-alanine carboxypeptidase/D-alanyl-D-alanine-endopeptidase, partial [Candidatus Eremiobacteraeota bacterium]|nr:D-alanyl-D-alanine carboxypeptidase/D-alanyl-D-alanine-endopeptidase [Candidatus Eremiobacteraeota bacterium]